MRFGMNLLMWTDTLNDEIAAAAGRAEADRFRRGRAAGLRPRRRANYAKWGKRLDELGLARTGTAIRGADDNPISADPAVRRKGVEANKRTLDCCAAAGCEVMAGPFHSALGCFSGKGRDRRRVEVGASRACARWPSTPRRSA